MKYFFPAFFFLLLISGVVKSQNLEDFQPIELDQGFTPYQRYIPFEFLFLVDNELTKVIYNPAFLSEADSSALYATVEPGIRRNYRLAYISPKKWMVRGSFMDDTDDSNSLRETSSDEQNTSLSGIFREEETRTSTEDLDSSQKQNTHAGEIQVSRLLPSSSQESFRAISFDFSYSISTWDSEWQRTRLTTTDTELYRNDTLETRRSVFDYSYTLGEDKTNRSQFQAGITFSFARERLQGVHRFYGEYGDIEVKNNSINSTISGNILEEVESDTSFLNSNRRNIGNINNTIFNPWNIGYKGYFNRQLNWMGEDYIFATVQANYGSDEGLIEVVYDVQNLTTNNSGSEGSNPFETNLAKRNASAYLGTGLFTFGYVVKKEHEDLTIFAGLSQTLAYSQFEGFTGNRGVGILSVDENLQTATTTIPIFGEYQLNKWISVFGGATTNLNYTSSTQELRTDIPTGENSISDPDSYLSKTTSQEYIERTTSYFGLKASHKSGITVLADVNGDLSRLSTWYFTIGYKF